jgi:hypothetical protein
VIANVISARRPQNVAKMQKLLAPMEVRWWVDIPSLDSYDVEGAQWVCGTEGGVAAARNTALEFSIMRGEPYCIQFDDDLQRCTWLRSDGAMLEYSATQVVHDMIGRLAATDFKLAGVAPTNNPFFSKGKSYSSTLFINGSCIVISLPSEPRFDEGMRLKEDYDFVLQHYARYGGALRCDDLVLTFDHRKQPGGAVSIRTPEVEQEAIAHLKAKWGSLIRDNPRRENEVLLNIPRRKREVL